MLAVKQLFLFIASEFERHLRIRHIVCVYWMYKYVDSLFHIWTKQLRVRDVAMFVASLTPSNSAEVTWILRGVTSEF